MASVIAAAVAVAVVVGVVAAVGTADAIESGMPRDNTDSH